MPTASSMCFTALAQQHRLFTTSTLRRSTGEPPKSPTDKAADAEAASASSSTEGSAGSTTTSSNNAEETTTSSSSSTTTEESNSNSTNSQVERVERRPDGLTRVKRTPLQFVEEVPLPMKLMGDLELVMTAWSEEHARQLSFSLWLLRILTFVSSSIIIFFFYKSMIGSERMIRGVGHVPQEMKVGCVVYLDIQEEGRDIGRIVIGLLTDICPLYCEYFHRRCTGNGGKGESFRGLRMTSMVPGHVSIFGDGRKMTHDLEGFEPHSLPTEALQTGPWRGCLSSIAVAENRESPNFCIHASSSDNGPQVFGIVMAGYDVVERMHATGVTHAANPRRSYVVSNCGELCTLDRANIVPLPWKLYDSVSEGYDEERFGARSDWATMMPTSDLFTSAEALMDKVTAEGAAVMAAVAEPPKSKKSWYKFW